MSLTPQTPREETDVTPAGAPAAGPPRWVVAVLVVLALFLLYIAYAQHAAKNELAAQLQQASDRLAKLESRAAALEESNNNLKSDLAVTSQKLGVTQEDLGRARALAQQAREEQRRAAAQLAGQVEQQKQQLGSLSGEVGTARSDIAATRQELQQTQMKLERTIGDLGIQSGLIARNGQELDELKKRGERDYFEFDLRKAKQFTKVGPLVSLRLNKTDTKRQKFTLTVLANDKQIEKKDRTLLEPVQFYLQGTRHLLEVVVYTVDRDHVVGYLSTPKEVAQR